MSGAGEMKYLVLADRAVPYLLARVRWPDVAQAISAAYPDWLDDPGLFDLPYDPNAVMLSFAQAASVAAGWGRQLHAEATEGAPSYIRRMPANWSDLSPSERRIWGIEFVGRRRDPARRVRRLRPFPAKIAASSAAAQVNGHVGALAGLGAGPSGPDAAGLGQPPTIMGGRGDVAAERRDHARVRVDGRAHIRSGPDTISTALVDLSEGGARCVLLEAPPGVTPGAMLGGPFLLEAEGLTSRICLAVPGRISWHRSSEAGTHFGVAFAQLAAGEADGMRRLLADARKRAGNR